MIELQTYTQPPILNDNSSLFNNNQIRNIDTSLNINKPIQQFINQSIDAINQTIKNTIQNTQSQNISQVANKTHSYQDDWNLLYFIKIFFYALVILKVLQLVFNRRRKMDIKQRVYKKYIFSHAQIIRQFDQDDRKVMETTLSNTIKNAYIQKTRPKMIKKISNKKVNFHQTKNEYIQPRKNSQEIENMSPLQMFLSQAAIQQSPMIKVQQMKKQQDEPNERQFQIVETIKQSQVVQKVDRVVFKNQIESIITTTTQSSEILAHVLRQKSDQSQISSKKQ